MKNSFIKKTLTQFAFLLYLVLRSQVVFCQNEQPKKGVVPGYKVVTTGAVVVYQDMSDGHGNFSKGSLRLLTHTHFVAVSQTTFVENNKTYRLILVTDENGNKESSTTGNQAITNDDYGRGFWVLEDDLIDNFTDYVPKSKWSLYITTMPFKYRWSYKNSQSTFTGESTLGPTISWRFSKDNFGNVFNLAGGIGYSILNKASVSDTTATANENGATGAFSAFLGISANINEISISAFYGYDFTSDDYLYNRKPWISVGISGKISTLAYYLVGKQ